MKIWISTALLSFALTSTASAKEKADPHTFGEVVLFGFGGTIDMDQTQTKTGLGALDSAKAISKTVNDVNALGDGSMKSAAQAQSEAAFQHVEAGLEAAFGWKVMDLAPMVEHADYASLWDAKTPNINKKMAGWGGGMVPTGVLYKDRARMLDQEERDTLMTALGVDYVAIASITISGDDKGVSVGGVGTSRIKPKTLTMVSVYHKGEKKPVWKGSAVGKKTTEAIKADFGNTSEGEAAILLESIDNSMAKLKQKFAAD